MQLFPCVELFCPLLLKPTPAVNVAEQQLAPQVGVHSSVVEHHLIHQLEVQAVARQITGTGQMIW